MTKIIEFATGKEILRKRVRKELAVMAGDPEIVTTPLGLALAWLIEQMDKKAWGEKQ